MVDSSIAIDFLRMAFEPEDWVAILLKSYRTGDVLQRIGPVRRFLQPGIHGWLRALNAHGYNVYVSVNALALAARTRTKSNIVAIRHVFLEADSQGVAVLGAIISAEDLPAPSYVSTSSPDHVHILWRAAGFDVDALERLQKHLAARLRTDRAATSASQTTRLPGYRNRKYSPAPLVTIDYRDTVHRFNRSDFPRPPEIPPHAVTARATQSCADHRDRARRYLAQVAPAVAGQHGDLHTFRVCCRIARGFDLSDADAFAVLREWNARCEPPWTDRELQIKIAGARRYGHESVGGLR